MSGLLGQTELAAPLLAGSGLRWLVIIALVVGVVVTFVLVHLGRRPTQKQAPPMTKPRLLPRDDDRSD